MPEYRVALKEGILSAPGHCIRPHLPKNQGAWHRSQTHGSKKLVGGRNLWRIRVGDYRVIYTIEDELKSVEVTRIAPARRLPRLTAGLQFRKSGPWAPAACAAPADFNGQPPPKSGSARQSPVQSSSDGISHSERGYCRRASRSPSSRWAHPGAARNLRRWGWSRLSG